jgi:hypothetical protein
LGCHRNLQRARIAMTAPAHCAGSLALLIVALAAPRQADAQEGGPFRMAAGQLKRYPFSAATGINSSVSLFYDFDISTYQALIANVKFKDQDNKQKVNLAPFKFRRDAGTCTSICELTLNLVRSSDATTFGIGWAYDAAAPYHHRLRDALRVHSDSVPAFATDARESKDARAERLQAYLKETIYLKVLSPAYHDLMRHAVAFGVGSNVQLFHIVHSTPADLDGNGRVDNANSLKGFQFGPSLTFNVSLATSLQGSYTFLRKRGSAEEGSPLASYHGVSLTVRQQLAILDPGYETSEAWVKSMFIPSTHGGVNAEWLRCTASDISSCEKQTRRTLTVTAFADFRFKPDLQFRLGVPFQFFRAAAKNSTEVDPLFQFALNVSGL